MNLQEKKTETEQIYDDMTSKVEAEEKEEQAEQEQEQDEIVDDEQLEIEREIAEYKAKIAEIDAKLAEFEAKKIDDNKRELMRKWCYTDAQIERFLKFIEGETAEEIEKSIAKLAEDFPPAGDSFADPSPFNGVKQKPKPADLGEVGKTLFERIKNKIWGGGVFL